MNIDTFNIHAQDKDYKERKAEADHLYILNKEIINDWLTKIENNEIPEWLKSNSIDPKNLINGLIFLDSGGLKGPIIQNIYSSDWDICRISEYIPIKKVITSNDHGLKNYIIKYQNRLVSIEHNRVFIKYIWAGISIAAIVLIAVVSFKYITK